VKTGDDGLVRWLVVLGLMGLVLSSTGCKYIQYRAEDMVEMLDIGVTFSGEPNLGLYACFASIVCLGFSDVDGWFFGMGGGQLGLIRHKNKCYGAMYSGVEDVVWGRGRHRRHYKHPMGMNAVLGGRRLPPPAYCPACTHYLHLGFIGAVANAKYAEMIDFIIGFSTLDIACDDGRKMGRWFWQ